MTSYIRKGSINKSARLVLLMELQDKGLLEKKSLSEIGKMLPQAPGKMTIRQDLIDVKRLRVVLRSMRKKVNYVKQ